MPEALEEHCIADSDDDDEDIKSWSFSDNEKSRKTGCLAILGILNVLCITQVVLHILLYYRIIGLLSETCGHDKGKQLCLRDLGIRGHRPGGRHGGGRRGPQT